MERHHICPKSDDMFPEYKDLKTNPWNLAVLTPRQHFIAHYLLYKSHGGKQTYAFRAMCNQVANKNTKRTYRVNSTIYSRLKQEVKSLESVNKGKSAYVDDQGNRMLVSTDDPRVLSGELVHVNKGRTGTFTGRKHSPETIEKMKNKKMSAEAKEKISKSKIGISQSSESNLKRSNTLKGRIPWNKGKPATEEAKRNNALAQTGLKRRRHDPGLALDLERGVVER